MKAGQTRLTPDGQLQVWTGDSWICGEPVTNTPEGMCSEPVDAGPCPTHRPFEAALWQD